MHLPRISWCLFFCLALLVGCTEEELSPGTTESPSPTDTLSESPQTSEEGLSVVVLGNSIAAGYGVGPEQAFPALLQDKIDEAGWEAEVVNAGVSGETTAGGLRRVDWLFRQRSVDVLVVELGGNDGLRGVPVEQTRENLQSIIDRAREHNPEARIILTGIQLPPNFGEDYTARFREIYYQLAEENNIELVPFLFAGLEDRPELFQSDRIHPTARGQRAIAENVWNVLEPVLADLHEDAQASERIS